MRGETPVSFRDQLLIETIPTNTRLVPGNQLNTLSMRIKCKSHSPDTASRIKSKLLHVGVF